jgi:hypothetical protein
MPLRQERTRRNAQEVNGHGYGRSFRRRNLGDVRPQAPAIGNDNGVSTDSGNGAEQSYGNQATDGNLSSQLSAVQGSLNKLCVGLPAKGDEPLSHILDNIPVLSGNGASGS